MKFQRGNVKIYTNKNKSLPKLVIFRDSFSNSLLKLLCESFSRIVAVSSWHYLVPLIESERPDYVVTQVAERYLCGPSTPVLSDQIDIYVLPDFLGMTLEQIKEKQ